MDDKDYVRRSEFSQLSTRVGKNENRLERHETKIEHVEDTLADIKGNTNKIIWLIISAIILAVLKMIFEDGLL